MAEIEQSIVMVDYEVDILVLLTLQKMMMRFTRCPDRRLHAD